MFDGKFRAPVERAVRPIGNGLRRTGLTPDHLTVAGIVIAVGAAVMIARGQLIIGLVLVILAALPDLFDGALAKASDASSQRGAYFDSVIDRVTDAMLFGGVAWYLASNDSAHMSHAAVRDHGRCRRSSRTSGRRPSRSGSTPRAA